MTRRRDLDRRRRQAGRAAPELGPHDADRPAWAARPDQSQRERDIVGKIAVYRDRFGVQGDGLGAAPAGNDARRIWQGLSSTLHALQRSDDRDEDRHLEVERDVGLER